MAHSVANMYSIFIYYVLNFIPRFKFLVKLNSPLDLATCTYNVYDLQLPRCLLGWSFRL